MLPEVGALEYLIIAAVALIVVGPKDLPMLLRRLGQFVAKLRGMASEFRASFDEMARQSELDDLRKEVEAMRRGQFADIAAHDQELNTIAADLESQIKGVGVSFDGGVEAYNYDDDPKKPPPPAAAPEHPPLTISEAPKPRKPRAARPKAAPAAPEAAPAPKATPRRASTAKGKSVPLVETPKSRRSKSSKIVEAGS